MKLQKKEKIKKQKNKKRLAKTSEKPKNGTLEKNKKSKVNEM